MQSYLKSLLATCESRDGHGLLTATKEFDNPVGRHLATKRSIQLIHQMSRQAPERVAESVADKWAYRGTKQWFERYSATLREYSQVWLDAEKEIRLALDQVRGRERALRERHEDELDERVLREVQPLVDDVIHLATSANGLVRRAHDASARETGLRATAMAPWLAVEPLCATSRRQGIVLSPDDRRLAQLWAADKGSNSSYWTTAMESARRAERVACELYSELYGTATDLSVLQLQSSDTSWQIADVAVGGRMIDVKNARRSFSSPEAYSEHCVPRFKTSRTGGQDVTVSAFLSPYLAPLQCEEIVWIGETTLAELQHLFKAFRSDYLELKVVGDTSSYLPPWVFDYPVECYRARDAAVNALRGSTVALPRACPIGAQVLAHRSRGLPQSEVEMEAELLAQTLRRFDTLRRPVLFLHVLNRFCSALKDGRSFPERSLREIMFPFTGNDATAVQGQWVSLAPLAVCDPLGTIEALISLLAKVALFCGDSARRFTVFRLASPAILQGRDRHGPWQTIFAYCGGWRRLEAGGSVRCGQNPLYLGQEGTLTCALCQKLICPNCGFCTHDCPEYVKRRDCRPRSPT